MRKWLVFILLLGLIASPTIADAQAGTKLASMSIEFWSEFDQPSMLVINEFVVSDNTALPTTVTLRFPTEGNLIAVAVKRQGELFDKPFDPPEEQGDWQTITLNVETYEPHHIEYYQPLTRDGNKRLFKYQWFGDYYVKQFDISVLVPADSTEITTYPNLSATELSSSGLHQFGTISKGEMKMGKSFEFRLEYERTSDVLTAPNQDGPVQPSEPVSSDTSGRVSIDNLPWIIGGFGLALIIIALLTYWRSTQTAENKPQRRRRHTGEVGDTQIYCHECGARAHAGDRFCRTCGSRFRVE